VLILQCRGCWGFPFPLLLPSPACSGECCGASRSGEHAVAARAVLPDPGHCVQWQPLNARPVPPVVPVQAKQRQSPLPPRGSIYKTSTQCWRKCDFIGTVKCTAYLQAVSLAVWLQIQSPYSKRAESLSSGALACQHPPGPPAPASGAQWSAGPAFSTLCSV